MNESGDIPRGGSLALSARDATSETTAPRFLAMLCSRADLREAIMLGAGERVRPKMMTVVVPILWSTGSGSEVAQRIAVPMIGATISSTVLTLIVIPSSTG